MISFMSLRLVCLVLTLHFAAACSGAANDADEPQTAREKQYAEAKKSGELDAPKHKSAATWRYSGDRKDCRYVIGRKCFKDQKAACAAAACGAATCDVVGAGPASVSCKKA
ncbi:hypothetical protein BH11MYX1_BH11MYX1_37770 [soil metagenome]